MGCGHSKINIYPKRNRNKNAAAKKTVTPEKVEDIEEEAEVNSEQNEDEQSEEVDPKAAIKVKPYGGPLVPHPELSASQNNFFKMLDEKIESGPDYDSSSENEKAMERERLTSLLKDWESASSGSRSLPATPKRRPHPTAKVEHPPAATLPAQRAFNQSIIHQSYGVTPYRQAYSTPPIYHPSVPLPPQYHPQHPSAQYSPMQYQALSSLYGRQLLGSSPVKSSYASPGTANTSPKHIPSYPEGPSTATFSPKMYKTTRLSNGDLIQQQIYQQQLQYQQAREYQQYKQSREQQLIQQQQQQQQGYSTSSNGRSYQSSIHIPIVAQNDIPQYDHT